MASTWQYLGKPERFVKELLERKNYEKNNFFSQKDFKTSLSNSLP